MRIFTVPAAFAPADSNLNLFGHLVGGPAESPSFHDLDGVGWLLVTSRTAGTNRHMQTSVAQDADPNGIQVLTAFGARVRLFPAGQCQFTVAVGFQPSDNGWRLAVVFRQDVEQEILPALAFPGGVGVERRQDGVFDVADQDVHSLLDLLPGVCVGVAVSCGSSAPLRQYWQFHPVRL